MNAPPKIFVFDAYGTLFDVHSCARIHAGALGPAWDRVSSVWRAKQLEYTWMHAGMGTWRPFRDVTRQSLHYALAECGIDAGLAPLLLETYQRLEPFPEVPDALRRLKSAGATLAILSNSDPDMLDDLVASAALAGVFDHVMSARAAATFKPAPQVYALASKAFAVAPDAIGFVSSNRWDAAGAKAFGFRTVWLNRRALPDEYLDFPADETIADLSELAELPA